MLINPMTLTLFSRALNRYIALDPQANLAPLAGNTLCLDLSGTGKRVYFHFTQNHVLVEADCDTAPDVTLIASPVDLAKLFASSENRLLDDNVRIEGKVRVAQEVQHLFSSLDIDWEEQLSTLTGDVFAHHASRFTREFTGILKDVAKTMRLNTVEFLQEEAQILAVPECVTRFCESVDSTAMQTDRLEARIAQLKKKCNE
jgi:ubiquinone biosynthesis protein UbiJ